MDTTDEDIKAIRKNMRLIANLLLAIMVIGVVSALLIVLLVVLHH
jgi:hypothetical protein